jgi:folate-binding protein YgfZ
MAKTAFLEDRGFLRVSGPDALPFLQGIVTNDVAPAGEDRAVYACLLTPQGQYLHDFFVTRAAGGFLLECAATACAELIKRLTFYKLRSKVEIGECSRKLYTYAVWPHSSSPSPALRERVGVRVSLNENLCASLHRPPHPDPLPLQAGGEGILELKDAVSFVDPRLPGLGYRVYAAEKMPATATRQDYVDFCIDLGIPDSRTMRQGRDFLSALNLDQLNAVAWDKGCFVGQELTARIEYRGLAKKRMAIVTGSALREGEKLLEDSHEAGEIRQVNASQNKGLAVLKLSALNGRLLAGDGPVAAALPGWLRVSGI